MELRRRQGHNCVSESAVSGGQAVNRGSDKGVCAQGEGELRNTVLEPASRPAGGGSGAGGRPAGALGRRELSVHRGTGSRCRLQHGGEVRVWGDYDHVVVHRADHGGGVGLGDALHRAVHGGGVQQGTQWVAWLHPPLDPQPEPPQGDSRRPRRRGV